MIYIETNEENDLFEEVAFYKGMLGDFAYDPKEFFITFAEIKGKKTDVLRYIGEGDVIHLPKGIMAVPYLLEESYNQYPHITIVNHSNQLIDLDYMLYNTELMNVTLEGFRGNVHIQTAESAFENTQLVDIDIASMDLSECKNMEKMFARTPLKEADMSSVFMKSDCNMSRMFFGCVQLTNVKFVNVYGASLGKVQERLKLNVTDMFSCCSVLKDLQMYDVDTFETVYDEGANAIMIPESTPIYYNIRRFLQSFIPEFNQSICVEINKAFDIPFINEYSMLLSRAQKLTEEFWNDTFVFKVCRDVKLVSSGMEAETSSVRFVSALEQEQKNGSELSQMSENTIFVLPRGEEINADLTVYALYDDKTLQGYRIRYEKKYYDISLSDYVQLGLTGTKIAKKLKLTNEDGKLVVHQRHGAPIEVLGMAELAQVLGVELDV